MSEIEKSNRLEAERAGKNIRNIGSPAKKSSSSRSRLTAYLRPQLDWLFIIALSAAMIKDLLDLIGFGSIPLIGTAVTMLASITILIALFFTGSNSKRKAIKSGFKKYLFLGIATIVEMLFGLNFVPFETFAVVIAFHLTLKERRDSSQENEQPSQAPMSQNNYNNWDYADAA